jgi:hypothetical protein
MDKITQKEILQGVILIVKYPDIFSYEYAHPLVRQAYDDLIENKKITVVELEKLFKE